MIRKDYIQRYFDELAKVLAAVLQLKNDFKPTEAEAKLNDFSTDYLGIPLAELLSLNPAEVIDYLIKEKEFTLTHFKLLEDILYQQYLLKPSENHLKQMTLTTLRHTSVNDTNYSIERATRIKELSV
tara:strand:+ start:3386 stop:3766 length:381 start_codon:yes stop_codon:yes gene_type:complete